MRRLRSTTLLVLVAVSALAISIAAASQMPATAKKRAHSTKAKRKARCAKRKSSKCRRPQTPSTAPTPPTGTTTTTTPTTTTTVPTTTQPTTTTPSTDERYVSPSGSDSGDGSSSSPWGTIGKGLTSTLPGQILVIHGGTYTQNIDVTVHAGSSSAPVVVRAASGERPVLYGKLWVHSANFWTFDGVNVTWGTGLTSGDWMVRVIGSHDWRWTNSELWGAHSTAELGLGPGYNFRVDHNYIHDTYPSNDTNQDHNIYATTELGHGQGGTGTIERNIIAHSPNGRGIKIGGNSLGCGGLTVRYNTFYDNLGPSNIQLSDGAADNLIYRNIFARSHSGYDNVTRYNGLLSGSVAYDNVGWLSAGVADAGPGLNDGGGNLLLDPQLDSNFRPQSPQAQAYGRYAS